MTYRPQYVYPPCPAGYRDEQFHYSFDSTLVPALGNAIAAGQYSGDIILPLEADADFIACAFKIQAADTSRSTLSFQLKTPHGDYIETAYVPVARYAGEGDGALIAGRLLIPIEEAVWCPAGSNWTIYFYNPTSGSVTPPRITLFGVKRRKCGNRKAA